MKPINRHPREPIETRYLDKVLYSKKRRKNNDQENKNTY